MIGHLLKLRELFVETTNHNKNTFIPIKKKKVTYVRLLESWPKMSHVLQFAVLSLISFKGTDTVVNPSHYKE
jgi:hypothetical protein